MEIAGIPAKAIELHVRDEDGEINVDRYWYAPEIKVNPLWFTKYRAYGANRIYELIDSLVIGYERFWPYATVRRMATSVVREPIPDERFELADLPVMWVPIEESSKIPPCSMR